MTSALRSYEADKATANVYRDLRAATAHTLGEALRSHGITTTSPALQRRNAFAAMTQAEKIRIDVLESEVHRLADLVREYEMSAGQTAALHPEVVR